MVAPESGMMREGPGSADAISAFVGEAKGLKSVDRAYRHIRQIIISGRVAPGTHLTEIQLSRVTGLSRTPIRDALRRLRTEGLVVRGPNNGAAVATFSDTDVAAIREIRCRLEGYAAERAATRISAAEIKHLEAIAAEMERVVRGASIDRIAFADLNAAFHLGVAEAAGSPHLTSQIQSVVQLPLILLRRSLWPSEPANERGMWHHREIIEALKIGDAYWVGTQMRAHIASSLRG
jgi:DNA-binding GntR family transcriptional regulator